MLLSLNAISGCILVSIYIPAFACSRLRAANGSIFGVNKYSCICIHILAFQYMACSCWQSMVAFSSNISSCNCLQLLKHSVCSSPGSVIIAPQRKERHMKQCDFGCNVSFRAAVETAEFAVQGLELPSCRNIES